jgi:hypothetical protein
MAAGNAQKFTTVFLELLNDMCTGDGSAPATYYVHMGTSGEAAVPGDTALAAPSAEARASCTESQPTSVTWQEAGANITSLSDQTIAELGMFTSLASTILVARRSYATGFAILTGDLVQITFVGTSAQA